MKSNLLVSRNDCMLSSLIHAELSSPNISTHGIIGNGCVFSTHQFFALLVGTSFDAASDLSLFAN